MKVMQHVIQEFIHKICKAQVQYRINEEHTIYCDLRKENKLIKKTGQKKEALLDKNSREYKISMMIMLIKTISYIIIVNKGG